MISSIIELGGKIIDKVIPDKAQADTAKLKLLELQQNGDLKLEEFSHNEMMGQIDINKIEAQSSNLFIAGWRPFIGWSCGCGFVYQLLLQPIITGIIDHQFPVLDMNTLIALLGALLGLGGYRTYEKIKGASK